MVKLSYKSFIFLENIYLIYYILYKICYNECGRRAYISHCVLDNPASDNLIYQGKDRNVGVGLVENTNGLASKL